MYWIAKISGKITVGVKFHVRGYSLNCILVSFYFGFLWNVRQGVHHALGKLVGLNELLRASLQPVDWHFIDLQLVDALAVLVHQADHTLKELLQRLALKIETHKVSGVMTIGLQKLI